MFLRASGRISTERAKVLLLFQRTAFTRTASCEEPFWAETGPCSCSSQASVYRPKLKLLHWHGFDSPDSVRAPKNGVFAEQ